MPQLDSERNGSDGDGSPALLVATDGSDAALHAGERATVLARGLGAKLFILNVVDPHEAFQAGIHYAEVEEALERKGNKATKKIATLAPIMQQGERPGVSRGAVSSD